MKVIFLLTLISLAGCTTATPERMAIMHNPETGDTERCEVDPWRDWSWEFSAVIRQCVSGYEKAGYVRVDTPPNSKAP